MDQHQCEHQTTLRLATIESKITGYNSNYYVLQAGNTLELAYAGLK